MNATVTKSAAKGAAVKIAKGSKPAAPAAKPAKSVVETGKPTKKTAAAATKSVAKPPKTQVKSKVEASAPKDAKTATGTAPAKKAAPAATRASGSRSTASRASGKEPGTSLSSDNASAGLTDTMETSAVSKVREVATKQNKSTPAPADGALLTEEQILAMSEKDYMNEAQLAFFKARLQQLERDLLKNAGETTEHLRETVLVPDPADRATIEEEHALELRTRDRERKLLKKVQQSLASIESGEYGWCEETGEPIGIPRLLARPTATLSLEAQQRRELKQKLYGD